MDGFVFGEFRVVVGGRGRGARVERAAPEGGRRGGGRGGGDGEAGPSARVPRRRASHPHTGAVGTLVGREEQLGLVRSAVRSRRMVEFTAKCGSGKTSLLRAVAPDAYIRVGAADLEDFLQDMVREFYEYPPGAPRLTTDECRSALEQVVAVVALDDVGYGPLQIADLRDALRGCAVLMGAVRPGIGRLGVSHPLPGLTAADAMTLLSRDLDRIVTESELPHARRLVAAVGGRPLALRQAAALVRYEGRGFAELAGEVELDPGVLDELAIAVLDPESKRALAVLALLGGAHLPARLVAAMAEVPTGAERFEWLCARGLAEKRGDRFGLPTGLPEPYLRLLHRHLDFGVSLRALGSWIEARDPCGAEARQAADAAVPLLGTAAGRGEWDTVIALAAIVEPVLCIQGHWRSWQRTLEIGRIAALELPDVVAEAHFAHQEGTLHLLEGRPGPARDALAHALELRTRYARAADDTAAEDTRANLALLADDDGDSRGAGGAGALRALLGGRPAGMGRAASRRARTRARRRHRALVGVGAATAVLAAGVAVAVGAVGRDGLGVVGGSGWHHSASAAGAKGGPAASGSLPGAQRVGGGTKDQDAPGDALPTVSNDPADPGGALKPLTIKGAADYGDVHAGASAAPVTKLTITNPNGKAVALDAITLSARSDFAITTGSCRTGEIMSPGFLDDGEGGGPAAAKGLAAKTSCSVTVRFTPTALGKRADTLTVSYGKGGRSTAHLTGRAFATVKVTVTPETGGLRHGYVDIAADGTTTKCDQATPCTVRYFDAKTPLSLKAHGDPVGADSSGATGGTGGTAGASDSGGSSTVGSAGGAGDAGGSGTAGGSDASGGSSGSGGTASTPYTPDSWTGPCTGSLDECDLAPGGDLTTSVHFAPDNS